MGSHRIQTSDKLLSFGTRFQDFQSLCRLRWIYRRRRSPLRRAQQSRRWTSCNKSSLVSLHPTCGSRLYGEEFWELMAKLFEQFLLAIYYPFFLRVFDPTCQTYPFSFSECSLQDQSQDSSKFRMVRVLTLNIRLSGLQTPFQPLVRWYPPLESLLRTRLDLHLFLDRFHRRWGE